MDRERVIKHYIEDCRKEILRKGDKILKVKTIILFNRGERQYSNLPYYTLISIPSFSTNVLEYEATLGIVYMTDDEKIILDYLFDNQMIDVVEVVIDPSTMTEKIVVKSLETVLPEDVDDD